MVRGMCFNVWRSTQTGRGEELRRGGYYAAVKGSIRGSRHRLAHHGADRQPCLQGHLWTGIGKIKHMAIQMLWLQDVVRRGAVEIRRVRGDVNAADLMT